MKSLNYSWRSAMYMRLRNWIDMLGVSRSRYVCRVELAEPTTLAQAMTKAQRVDGITYHSRTMNNMDPTSNNTYRTSAGDSVPMDLGMVHGNEDADSNSELVNAIGDRSYQQGSGSMRNNNSRYGTRRFSPHQRVSQDEFKYCQEHRLR